MQTWWRTVIQRQRYLQWQQRQQEERERQPQRRDLNFFRQHLRSIVLVQACWRRWIALRAYQAIKRGDMPLCTLRRFLHLLDIGQVRQITSALHDNFSSTINLLLNTCSVIMTKRCKFSF